MSGYQELRDEGHQRKMGLVSGATKRICVVLELYSALTAVLHTHIYSIQNSVHTYACKHAKVLQPCPTLCDPMICSLSGSSVHGNSPDKNTGVGCHALLQGIFPSQKLNPGILHGKQILYHLSHQGSPQQREIQVKSQDSKKQRGCPEAGGDRN